VKSPTRRAALALGVGVLLVTAGCLGVTNPTDTDSSPAPETAECSYDATGTASITNGTWSPEVSTDQYPPGVADNGTLTNVSTLLDAHFGVTANTSMALRLESSRHSFVRTLVHGPDRVPFYSTHSETHDRERVETEFYRVDQSGFARVSLPNETRHVVHQNASTGGISAWTKYGGLGSPENEINGLLDGGNYSVNGTVERGDRTFVQLTTGPDSLETGHITNGTALVTPGGLVYDVNATVVQITGENTERRLGVSMSLDTDVEWCGAPSWVGDLPQLSLSIVEDGQAVEIRNTGGAALPANTTFDVEGEAEPVIDSRLPLRSEQNGTVTTDTRLEPGEVIYMTANGEGVEASFALHDDPTRGEYTFGAAGIRGGNETVYFRLLTGVEPPEWAE